MCLNATLSDAVKLKYCGYMKTRILSVVFASECATISRGRPMGTVGAVYELCAGRKEGRKELMAFRADDWWCSAPPGDVDDGC